MIQLDDKIVFLQKISFFCDFEATLNLKNLKIVKTETKKWKKESQMAMTSRKITNILLQKAQIMLATILDSIDLSFQGRISWQASWKAMKMTNNI